jgi:hypothetical protein
MKVDWQNKTMFFLRTYLLFQTFRTDRYTEARLTDNVINPGGRQINLNHEDMREPYSLNFNDIMCTYEK